MDRVGAFLSGDERRGTIIASALIVLLIVACAATAGVYRANMPPHVDANTINFTQDEYDQALAKWESREVAEYTTTARRGRDQLTIRVNTENDEIFLLEWLRDGEPYEGATPDPNRAVLPGLYQQYRVEAMFDKAREWLDLMASGQQPEMRVGETVFYQDYVVRFDPELGYPSYLAHHTRSVHRTRELVWRQEAEPIIEVKQVTVVR